MWSLIRLGPASTYQSEFGLGKWDGFVTNANYLSRLNILVDDTISSDAQGAAKTIPEKLRRRKDEQQLARESANDGEPLSPCPKCFYLA
jgi:hypothetical protein